MFLVVAVEAAHSTVFFLYTLWWRSAHAAAAHADVHIGREDDGREDAGREDAGHEDTGHEDGDGSQCQIILPVTMANRHSGEFSCISHIGDG